MRKSSLEHLKEMLNNDVLDISVDREYLLGVLVVIIETSLKKLNTQQTYSAQKPKYARIIVSAVSAANSILTDRQEDELEKRIEALEEAVKVNV